MHDIENGKCLGCRVQGLGLRSGDGTARVLSVGFRVQGLMVTRMERRKKASTAAIEGFATPAKATVSTEERQESQRRP